MKTEKMRVIEGPLDAGNVFGYLRPGLIPVGRWAVVVDAAYVNGGRGPCVVIDASFPTREAAEAELARLTA